MEKTENYNYATNADLLTDLCVSHVWLFDTTWTVAQPAPLSMEFSRQEYWRGCHFLLQGILPIQGSNLLLIKSTALAGGSLPLVPPGKSLNPLKCLKYTLDTGEKRQETVSV